jgi:hypothetical protein
MLGGSWLVQRWNKPPYDWVTCSRGERFFRVEQLQHRAHKLLGVLSAKAVPRLTFTPSNSVAALLMQHLDELEQEAERTGGIVPTLTDHCATVDKVDSAPAPAAVIA